MPIDEALVEIRTLSGRQFDPRVVEAFESLDHVDLLSPVSPDGSASWLEPAAA